MKKKLILLKPHSVVDVITNSSTELFIIDDERSLEIIRSLINEIQGKYPNEYGHRLSVSYTNEYELNEVFGYINKDESIAYLKALGYTIIYPDDKEIKKYISISCERGGIQQQVYNFINSNFNVINYTTEV